MTKPSVIVLDDELSVCESIKIVLANYDVHFVLSTSDCLTYMRANQKPNLMIIDYKVGLDDGIEFYRDIIIPEFGKIPAILISGYVGQKEQPDDDLKLASMFVRLVQKPFDIFKFKAVIEHEVELRSAG